MTGAIAVSPASLLGFYLVRSARNALAQKLRRLREPRYLVGLLLGIGYFAFILGRPNAPRARMRSGLPVTPQILGILLPAGAAVLAVVVLLGWLFRRGNPSLPLSEGEIQFLFPAPLKRRAVLHFALLRSQIGVFFSSFIVTLVLGRRAAGPAWQTGLGLWILLTALHFHFMALAFTKARWGERPAGRRLATKAVATAVVLAVLSILAVTIAAGLRRASEGLQAGRVASLTSLEAVFLTGPLGPLPFWILSPFRWVLAPLFAPSPTFFLARLPAALAVLLVQYVWVVRTNVSFEDATLENAARRAQVRARRGAGRLEALPPDRKRTLVPFPLGASGRPETAIVWKNLLSWRRSSLARLGGIALASAVLLFVASAAFSFPDSDAVSRTAVVMCFGAGVFVSSMLPMTLRNDLRGDLERADVLRLWPIPAVRLVAAELLAPILLSTLLLWGSLTAALAISGGRAARAHFFGRAHSAFPAVWFDRFGNLLPGALAVAVFFPAFVALILVVQNGVVLAFPAWFPPGRRRAAGLEQSGMRILSMLATLLLLTIALIPSGLLVALLFFAAWKTLGTWTLPVAGVLAVLPVLAEVSAGIFLLAKLFERFDPSLERTG
jgi:ABC-2 type transport system permease protein